MFVWNVLGRSQPIFNQVAWLQILDMYQNKHEEYQKSFISFDEVYQSIRVVFLRNFNFLMSWDIWLPQTVK